MTAASLLQTNNPGWDTPEMGHFALKTTVPFCVKQERGKEEEHGQAIP